MSESLVDTDMIGSVGTLIAASLETAGHHMQSEFLVMFDEGYASSVGGLLYVIAGISAIFIVAVGGQYKFFNWFLIGPALFWFSLGPRMESQGARWQFGEREHGVEMVFDSLDGVTWSDSSERLPEAKNLSAEVSAIFAIWNSFTSDLVRNLVAALNLTEPNSDVNFIKKSERYVKMFHVQLEDPELQKFINIITLSSKCVGYFGLQQALHDPSRATKSDIQAQIDEIKGSTVITNNHKSYNIISNLFEQNYFGEDAEIQTHYSCQGLWDLSLLALQNEANKLISRLSDVSRVEGVEQQDILNDLGMKFDPNNEQCDEKISEQECNDKKVLMMINAVAVRMFVDNMKVVRPGLAQLSLRRHLRINPEMNPYDRGKDHFDVTRNLKFLATSYEYHGKGEYLSAMLAMPYVQGIVLYFLALSYPFFCFALIIPGRIHTFLLWFGLWFWVKSWDFGFAVIMILDEILYALLPHGPALTEEMVENPGQAFQAVLGADPTYSVQIYYNIMATCLGAVPILTGVFIKRGGGEILQAVNQGFTGFSGRIGNSMAAFYRSTKAQQLKGAAEKSKADAVTSSIASSMMDPEVLQSLGMQVTSQAMTSLYKNNKQEFYNTAMKGFNNATSAYGKQYAMAKIKYNMAMASFNEGMSQKNKEGAQMAIMMKYYNHDFNDKFPKDAWLDLVVARENYQWGGVAGGTANNIKNKVLKNIISKQN